MHEINPYTLHLALVTRTRLRKKEGTRSIQTPPASLRELRDVDGIATADWLARLPRSGVFGDDSGTFAWWPEAERSRQGQPEPVHLRKPVAGCLGVYVLNDPQHVNEFSSAPNEKFTWRIQYTKEKH